MSIYHPPSKTQGVFNPSNFGGLGTGGQITTDYLDANYLQFPVSQGNATLVGTSVLGDITQQGDFYTTGDLLVNDVNIITEIGTKQDTIEDGDLTIAKTNGLQTALNDKQDTIEDGDLTIANTNGLQTALNDKQDTIEDGDLTIAKTDGLQTALTTLDTDITTINTNNIIYNSNEYGLKAVSNFISRTSLSGNWKKVVYAPELNLFVAIGDDTSNRSILTSTNGIDWNYSEFNISRALNDIVWSPELLRFVAVFSNADKTTAIYTSDDAITWTERKTDFITVTLSFPPPFNNVIGKQYINELNCVAWSPEEGLFVSIDRRGYIITSPDGITWTYRTRPNGNVVGTSVCWSSELNLFVAVFESGSHRVMVSSNGITWQIIEVSLNSWGDVVWSPQLGLFVAVADGGTGNRVMTSPDGTTWTDGSISDFSWDAIVWSDLGYFLAIARDGYIAYSNDGFNWVESVLSGTIRGGCWSKELGIFVIVGDDTIYTSSLKNRKPTNENIFNNEFNSIDEDGTWTFNALNINTDLSITGDLVVGSTNIITELGSNTNNLSSIQTQVDSLIDIFSQGISFRAYSLSSATISSGQNLPFDNESYDSQGTYDTTTNVYTIDIAGTYLFSFGWFVVEGSTASINLIRKRSGTETIIQQSTNGSYTGNNTSFFLATIDECEKDDEIYAYLSGGSCRLAQSDLTEPNNNSSFSGSRLSS